MAQWGCGARSQLYLVTGSEVAQVLARRTWLAGCHPPVAAARVALVLTNAEE